jgi:DNA-directed RNA polymerase specialized sigma subunit
MNENELFKKYVAEMDSQLRVNEKEIGKNTKQLMNELFRTEREFKALLLSTKGGEQVYVSFMDFIMGNEDEEKGNMLSCRPYFRERQDTFSYKIFKIFRDRAPERLHKYRINYKFCLFAIDNYSGPNTAQLKKLVLKMQSLRSAVCQNNLPLAINQAKNFWTNTPKSHTHYMDIIQSANEGLLDAIDKFSPPFKKNFIGTTVGRMTLEMTTIYNQTLIKFSPKERRVLYRVNKARNKKVEMTETEVQSFVNQSFKNVSSEDITKLESAANQTKMVNIDAKDDAGTAYAQKIASDQVNPEEMVEKGELYGKMIVGMGILKLIEKKIILMKFGEMEF